MATTQKAKSKNGAAKKPAATSKAKTARNGHSTGEIVYLAGLGIVQWSLEGVNGFIDDMVKRGEKEEKQLNKKWKDTRKDLETKYSDLVDDLKDRLGLDKPEAKTETTKAA